MQITPILICLVVPSIAQSAMVTKIPKPKLNSMFAQKLETPDIPKHKSPEERRKFSLFPKSYMKYVISPEPIYKIATHKPTVRGTKKPLMKKLKLQDKNKVIKNESEQPMIIADPMNESNVTVNPKFDNVVDNEKASIEAVKDKSVESNEKQNDDSKEEGQLNNDSNVFKTTLADTANKETLILTHNKLATVIKPIQFSAEIKNLDASSDAKKISKGIETPDWTEFIFVDPAHKPTEGDEISSEEPEEFATTEFYKEPEIVRNKRGSNIIEEENLASTVAGYKYTWKDTRLYNDVAFKNIHS